MRARRGLSAGVHRTAVALVVSSVLVYLALCGVIVHGLLDAPVLPVVLEKIVPERGCFWEARSRRGGTMPAGMVNGSTDGQVCVLAIAGVELGAASLVAEPGYLESREAFDAYVRDRAALYRALEGRSQTTVAILTDDGRELEAVVSVDRRGITRGWFDLFIGVAAALAFLAIGGLVLLLTPRRPVSRPMFVFSACLAYGMTISGTNATVELTIVPWLEWGLFQTNMFVLAVGGAAMVDMLGRFQPSPLPPGVTRGLRIGLYGIMIAVFSSDLLGLTYQALILAFFVCLLAGAALVIRAYLLARGQVQRLQVRWVLWGFSIPIVAALIMRLPIFLLVGPGDDPTDTLLTLFSVAFPISFYVSITRHRLLDLQQVTRRIIVGGGMILLIVVGLLLWMTPAEDTFGRAGVYPSVFTGVLLTAILFTFLWPALQRTLTDVLERVFFRRILAGREGLRGVPRELGRTRTADEAARLVLDRVGESLALERMVVAVAPHQGRDGSWHLGEVTLPDDEEFWVSVAQARRYELMDMTRAEGDPLAAWMEDQGFAIVIPLRAGDAFVGLLACGPPHGGGLYERWDVDRLETVAAGLAITLRQALALATIEEMNRELEQRVEERTSELDIARLQLYQSEKMRTLGQLAAGLAHELNTPLGVVSSASQRLADSFDVDNDGEASSESCRLVAYCRAAAAQASEIVGALQDFSRPGQEGTAIVDLRRSVETTLTVLRPALRAAAIETVLELQDIPTVECRAAQIHQALMNVVINAIQAMDHGGVLTVESGNGEEGVVWLAVADTGPGIPSSLRPRIFEPFFTTREPGEGAGLGLSLSYGIVRRHGGRIFLDPGVRQGTRVVLELPLRAEGALQDDVGT